MTDPTPPVVTRYLSAAGTGDIAALADCFAPTGTVIDEGHTYRGRAEIIAWREALASTWTFTSRVTGSQSANADEHRVTVRVEGNFPGGVADLTYHFTLHDGLVEQLEIAG